MRTFSALSRFCFELIMRVPIVKLPVAVFSHPSGYDPGGAIPTAGRSSANDVAMARDRAARMLDARMVMVEVRYPMLVVGV
jgi:hypothetical protein